MENITGFHLWQSFTTVVKLTENMRHLQDTLYGGISNRLRTGDQTMLDFEILNSRYLDPSNPQAEIHKEFINKRKIIATFPIAVQGNSSRHSITWLSACEI